MNNNDIVKQLVDGIIPEQKDKEKEFTPEEKEHIKEQRKRLEGRAWEMLIFMDD